MIGLQASSREVSINEVMSCALSPIPTALFNDSGDMQISKSKSTLKSLTKVDVSARHAAQEAKCTVIDGCALLWIPRWPSSTLTKQPLVIDYVNKFKDHIKEKLKMGDVYLVFDRYENYNKVFYKNLQNGRRMQSISAWSHCTPPTFTENLPDKYSEQEAIDRYHMQRPPNR